MRDELKAIATHNDFTLYDRFDQTVGKWRNLKLVRTADSAVKRNWWLAWNGERLARSRDAGLLVQHNPEIEIWVNKTLAGFDSVSSHSNAPHSAPNRMARLA